MVAEGICEINFPRELYLRQGNRFLPHQQLLYHGQLASQVELLKSDEGALAQRNPLLLPVLVRLHVQSVKRYRAMSEPISSKLLRSRVYRPLKKIEPVIGASLSSLQRTTLFKLLADSSIPRAWRLFNAVTN